VAADRPAGLAALAFPGSWLEPMWRLAVILMVVVGAACAAAAAGLWKNRRWGHRLAVGVLGVNLPGDSLSVVIRGDYRTLIELPIGGAMIAYLLSRMMHPTNAD
jgi:uncharacterized membrane protein (DUF2068 family)